MVADQESTRRAMASPKFSESVWCVLSDIFFILYSRVIILAIEVHRARRRLRDVALEKVINNPPRYVGPGQTTWMATESLAGAGTIDAIGAETIAH